jgi:hypothetical protein
MNRQRQPSSFRCQRVDNQIAVSPLIALGVYRNAKESVMLPRCRPAIEALECRLAPSLTPMFETPVAAIVQAPIAPAIHAITSSPATSAAVVAVDTVSSSITTAAVPIQAGDRAEFFASTFAEPAAQQLSPIELARERAVPVQQTEALAPSPARSGQPLLVWVLGMTCLLMLSWERHLRKPSLRHGVARRTRWTKILTDLSAVFAQVWRPRARSACA